jgi:hypothetical protein
MQILSVPPAPGAGATGTTPTGPASPSATTAALTPLPATSSSYIQPPTPIMGGLLQSTYGEFVSLGREEDRTRLDVGDEVQITKSASSYKLKWGSEKLQPSSKGIEDFI